MLLRTTAWEMTPVLWLGGHLTSSHPGRSEERVDSSIMQILDESPLPPSPASPRFCVWDTFLPQHTHSVFQTMASMFWHIAHHSTICFLSSQDLLRSLIHWRPLSCFFLFIFYYYFKIVSGRSEYKYLCLIHYLNFIFDSLSDINLLFFNCSWDYCIICMVI